MNVINIYLFKLFEKGNRDEFFKQTDKMFTNIQLTPPIQKKSQALRKLEF
jgi:23S rRNA U2552 (ribose-2'-O)-methylase RlmE/FtsJ